jgi:hypothetical protein
MRRLVNVIAWCMLGYALVYLAVEVGSFVQDPQQMNVSSWLRTVQYFCTRLSLPANVMLLACICYLFSRARGRDDQNRIDFAD